MHRTVLTFSLWAVCVVCFAGPFANLNAKIAQISDPKLLALVVLDRDLGDDRLSRLAKTVETSHGAEQRYALSALNQYISTRATAEGLGEDDSALSQVKQIKKSPLYRDEDVQSSNWFGKAGQALFEMIKKLLNFQLPKPKTPNMQLPSLLGPWVVYFMWAILGTLVAVLGYIALRHASWKRSLKRKASAMLDEDEPERSIDEWLERANDLERLGQYREAVRCLYLACLLKFDEARVARFDRGQTNWEHLARIQASPLRPAGLDFETTTRAFDLIWYGMQTKGKEDVDQFRAWYLHISKTLVPKAA